MMKKSLCILLAVLALASVFSACSKTEQPQKEQPSTTEAQEQFYDAKGNAYSSKFDVLFYDEQGTAYKLEMTEDYLPDYVNQTTGEKLNGFQCYVTEQGNFYFDKDNKLSLKKDTMSIYYDSSKNVYYDISTVSWEKDGTMKHKN